MPAAASNVLFFRVWICKNSNSQSTNPPMRYLLSIAIALAAAARAHEPTRGAHEASLDPRERIVLANATTLRAAVSEPATAAACALTLKVVDAETKLPLPVLVRVKRADGTAAPLAGLVNRGIKLRVNHPAKEWFALIEPTVVTLPREQLAIEAIGGLETELARAQVDLRGRDRHELTLAVKFFDRPASRGWRNSPRATSSSARSRAAPTPRGCCRMSAN